MSTASTDGLFLDMNRLTSRHWQGCFGNVLPRVSVSTDSLELREDGLTPRWEPHPVQSLWDEVGNILERALPSEESHQINPAWKNVIICLQEDKWPVADFFEPITFEFDPDIEDARAAARRYSEQTDADY